VEQQETTRLGFREPRPAPPVTDDDAPALRVAHGVRHEVTQDTLNDHRVGVDHRGASFPDERDALCLGLAEKSRETLSTTDWIANGRRSTVTTPASRRETSRSALKRPFMAVIDASICANIRRPFEAIATPWSAPTKRSSAPTWPRP
jgi:hypothetical protein